VKVHFLTAKQLVDKMGYTLKSGGNVYGYETASKIALNALVGVGVEISEDARICLQYTPPHWFTPIEGKTNVIFSMWEAEDIPPELLEEFAKADAIIVPSRNSKDALKRGGILKPIYICHQACDTDFYTFKEHDLSGIGGVIRFLWVGAPNVRKGYDLAIQAFYDAFHNTGAKVEFYIKSTLEGKEGTITPMPQFDAVVDTRNLPKEQLRELYWSAQVFLYPSRGEGAGLPPLEAMATGLPVIGPRYSGMRDYMHYEHSYPVKWTMVECDYGVKTRICEADMDDLVLTLWKVYNNIPQALEKGQKASKYINWVFSPQMMGKSLCAVLELIEVRYDR
jgi:glycosyltransferase involved in cell wall biosynthesis